MDNMPTSGSSTAPQTSPVTLDIAYTETISRWFVFRFLWWFLEIWIIYVWMLWIALIGILHFWYMLFLGKRHPTLWKKQLRFMRHLVKWQAYMMNLSNGRPDFITE